MSDAPPEDSNAALAWMWGQYVWVPLTWRINRRWGLHSAIARAMKTWLEGHVENIEAEGVTGLSNVSAALEVATTEGRHLLDQLETEFPAGTDPLTDAAAQEAVRRIVSVEGRGRLGAEAIARVPAPRPLGVCSRVGAGGEQSYAEILK